MIFNLIFTLWCILLHFSFYCRNGWLMEGRMAYPMQKADEDCGNRIGIIGGDRDIKKRDFLMPGVTLNL